MQHFVLCWLVVMLLHHVFPILMSIITTRETNRIHKYLPYIHVFYSLSYLTSLSRTMFNEAKNILILLHYHTAVLHLQMEGFGCQVSQWFCSASTNISFPFLQLTYMHRFQLLLTLAIAIEQITLLTYWDRKKLYLIFGGSYFFSFLCAISVFLLDIFIIIILRIG